MLAKGVPKYPIPEAVDMDRSLALLDEAYTRLHQTGPEFQGWLSNHGPMVAEAMIRHGHQDAVEHWLDIYIRRLEPFPASTSPIGSDWYNALGNIRRVADWTQYFKQVLAEQPWQIALHVWWPRLLPGIAAGATHGVIRVGHAVRTLLRDGELPLRLTELAHGLAYWAARWTPVTTPIGFWDVEPENPGVGPAQSALDPILDTLTEQKAPHADPEFDKWVGKMDQMSGWDQAMHQIAVPHSEAVPDWLAHVVDVAVLRYLRFGHGNGIMLVHSATAPNAVLRTLPALARRWWRPSAFAAWIAMATLTAIYAPPSPWDNALVPPANLSPDDAFGYAIAHQDEHVIKFADTAVDVYARTRNFQALAAIYRAGILIQP